MNESTIVAIVILVGVFFITFVAILKSGIDGAVKMWSVMGTLTGLAFGGITSYYFTSEVKQQEIMRANAERDEAIQMVNRSVGWAGDAYSSVLALESYLHDVEVDVDTATGEVMMMYPQGEGLGAVATPMERQPGGVIRGSISDLITFSNVKPVLLEEISKAKENLRGIQSYQELVGDVSGDSD